MKKYVLMLIAGVVVAVIAAGLWMDNKKITVPDYPGSDLVFDKYYPENEIAGMANDKSWREIRTSADTSEKIGLWYDQTFSRYRLTENRSDVHCMRKTWQQGEVVKLRTIICDHNYYRTVLTVVPQG